jgi:phosphomannomutase
MIPDEYEESVHLYVQAKTEKETEKILKEYTEKVNKWINE